METINILVWVILVLLAVIYHMYNLIGVWRSDVKYYQKEAKKNFDDYIDAVRHFTELAKLKKK